MMILVQRVAEAAVRIEGAVVGRIGRGLLVFFCAERGDEDGELDRLLKRLLKLRCFGDESGRMNRSVQDVGGGLLIVSQFTLWGDTRKGNRPSFGDAARPEVAKPLYEKALEASQSQGVPTYGGRFQAEMRVSLLNDGPVTLIVESPQAKPGVPG